MATSDGVMEDLRQFQRREFSKIGSFIITGKLVMGIAGFIVIVMILAFTFATADDSGVGGIGGSTIFTAPVITSSEAGPGESANWNNEGDSIEFGVDYGNMEWDWTNSSRLVVIAVTFTWETNDAAAAGSRDFSLTISSSNDSKPEMSQSQTAWDGTITLHWVINPVGENYTAGASSIDGFIEGLEVPGEGISGIARWDNDGSVSLNPSVSATVSSQVTYWDIDPDSVEVQSSEG